MAFVISRVTGNRMGWLFLAMSLAILVFFPFQQLAVYGLTMHPGAVPGAQWLAWVGNWAWILGFGPLLVFVTLLFPDGRLPSSRWRPFAFSALGLLALSAVTFMFLPGRYDNFPVRNPAGIDAARALLHALAAGS